MIRHRTQPPEERASRKATRAARKAEFRALVHEAVAEALEAGKQRRAKWRVWKAGRVG